MVTLNQIMVKLANADESTLETVGRVLSGNLSHNSDPDVRTVNATEAANRLGVSRPTVYRMMNEGSVKTITLRGVRRIVLNSLFSLSDNTPGRKAMSVRC